MKPFRYYINLLNEAAYDSMIAAMEKSFPDNVADIQWSKKLAKQDRVVWYLNVLKKYLPNPQPSLLGNKPSLKDFQETLIHYLGQQNIPKLMNYKFTNQPPDQVFRELDQIERNYQREQQKKAPVAPQEKDYKLISFEDGTAWWFVDRAYCSDEGRSGMHCGNIVGKRKTKQRILSYRSPQGHVILTFILEADGHSLGEMKAKGNQKPQKRYHPAIMALLLNTKIPIKSIAGMGYMPDANFSVFDLDENNLQIILNKNPQLISSQLKITPIEILRAPNWIKNDSKFQSIANKKLPGIARLLSDESSIKNWALAIKKNSKLILYAPRELPHYWDLMKNHLTYDMHDLLNAPVHVRHNTEMLSDLIPRTKSEILSYISHNTPGYDELCLLAVQNNAMILVRIPEEKRTPELCALAVKNDWETIQFVPKELQTPELCALAVKSNGVALYFVPKELQTPELCALAVKSNGQALRYVPKELQTPELCAMAVQNDGQALYYVPEELRTPKLCSMAVQNDGTALYFVPKELQTPELYLLAVKSSGLALRIVPLKLRTLELCVLAVQQNLAARAYVPEELRAQVLDQVNNNVNETIELSRLKQLITF